MDCRWYSQLHHKHQLVEGGWQIQFVHRSMEVQHASEFPASFLFPKPLYILQNITHHEIPWIHSNIFGVQKFLLLCPEYEYILNFKCHNWPTDCVRVLPNQNSQRHGSLPEPPVLTLCVGVIILGKWPSRAHGWIHENDLSKTSWVMRSVKLLNNHNPLDCHWSR